MLQGPRTALSSTRANPGAAGSRGIQDEPAACVPWGCPGQEPPRQVAVSGNRATDSPGLSCSKRARTIRSFAARGPEGQFGGGSVSRGGLQGRA